jgi:hypothetical protein
MLMFYSGDDKSTDPSPLQHGYDNYAPNDLYAPGLELKVERLNDKNDVSLHQNARERREAKSYMRWESRSRVENFPRLIRSGATRSGAENSLTSTGANQRIF